jgi:hypothetical protein
MAKRSGQKHYSKVVWPGFSNAPLPRQIKKIGRNEPCPCGSEKKYKDCHEKDGEVFLQKLAREEEKKRLKEVRREMKRKGVPWYRRIFFNQ